MTSSNPHTSRRTRRLPRIVLAMHMGSFCRGVLAGIADYAHSAGPWSFLLFERRIDADQLKRLGPVDGMVSLACSDATSRYLKRRNIPTVFVEATRDDLPQVIPDDRAIGRMAAEHFRDLGLERVCYLAGLPAVFARDRGQGFRERARELRMHLGPDLDEPRDEKNDVRRLERWLRELDKPVGIFAGHAGPARLALAQLNTLGIDVPNEVALLTVELLHLESRLSYPAISSIDIATRRIGYQAARMLADLMAGRPPTQPVLRIAPQRVRRRGSTDVLQVHDHSLSVALRFIRSRACDGIGVEDVMEQVSISRRSLELRFRKYLGRTIHKEIVRVRLEEAKRLLAETSLGLPDIAVRVGYEFSSNLCDVFRRELGAAPSQFRSNPGAGALF